MTLLMNGKGRNKVHLIDSAFVFSISSARQSKRMYIISVSMRQWSERKECLLASSFSLLSSREEFSITRQMRGTKERQQIALIIRHTSFSDWIISETRISICISMTTDVRIGARCYQEARVRRAEYEPDCESHVRNSGATRSTWQLRKKGGSRVGYYRTAMIFRTSKVRWRTGKTHFILSGVTSRDISFTSWYVWTLRMWGEGSLSSPLWMAIENVVRVKYPCHELLFTWTRERILVMRTLDRKV